MIAHVAMLDVRKDSLIRLTRLLVAHPDTVGKPVEVDARPRAVTRRCLCCGGSRTTPPFAFSPRSRGIAISTTYRYLHAGIDALATAVLGPAPGP